MKTKNKWLALLLASALCFSSVSAPVYAAPVSTDLVTAEASASENEMDQLADMEENSDTVSDTAATEETDKVSDTVDKVSDTQVTEETDKVSDTIVEDIVDKVSDTEDQKETSEADEEFKLGNEVTGYGVPLTDSTEARYGTSKVPTEAEAKKAMMAFKSKYPEGTRYTNDDFYQWKGGIFYGGYGCAGFAFMLSDAAFGDLPARQINSVSITKVHVGDILRVNNDTHSVIITDVYSDHVVLAEGNYNSSVHWGRTMTAAEVKASTYMMTRYPEGTFGEAWSIQFDANGGKDAPDSIICQRGKSVALPKEIPYRVGYKFLGWSTSKTAKTASYAAGDSYKATANVIMYAVWEKTSYTELGNVIFRDKRVNIPVATSVFYQFTAMKDGLYGFETVSGYDTYGALYDSNGKELVSDDDSGSGYNFLMAYYMKAGETCIIELRSYYTAKITVDLFCFISGEICMINYDANGGLLAPPASSQLTDLGCYVSDWVPVRDGYDFLGWAKTETATTAAYQPGEPITVSGDVTLYAVWQKSVVADLSDSLGKTISVSNFDQYGNAYYEFTPSKTGVYRFESSGDLDTFFEIQNENYQSLGIDDDSGTGSNFLLERYLTAGKTYYLAVGLLYRPRNESFTFKITQSSDTQKYNYVLYDLNHPEPIASYILSSYGKTNSDVTLEEISDVNEIRGWEFLGWSTDPKATSARYKAGSEYHLTADTTLYGVWKKITYPELSVSIGKKLDVKITNYYEPVIYQFTAPETDFYTFESFGSYNTEVKIKDQVSNLIDSSDSYGEEENFRLETCLSKGKTYYVEVLANPEEGQTANFQFSVSYSDVSGKIVDLTNSVGKTVKVSTVGYGTEKFFSFTASESQDYIFESTGDNDTMITLYDRTLKKVKSNDNDGSGKNFRLCYGLTAGNVYILGVQKKDEGAATFDMSIEGKPHSFTHYVDDNNATFTKDGTQTAVCDNGCKKKNTITLEGTRGADVKLVPTVTNTSTGMKITWKKVNGCTGYYVYRKVSGGSYTQIKKLTSADTLTYTDTSVNAKNGTAYIYMVKAYNGSTKGAGASKTYYRLTPVTLNSLTSSAKGKLLPKWTKNAKGTGYQIQYSLNSNMSDYTYVMVDGAGKLSKTLTGLASGKKYYVRIRVIKTVSGKNYYSAWSNKKSLDIK